MALSESKMIKYDGKICREFPARKEFFDESRHLVFNFGSAILRLSV